MRDQLWRKSILFEVYNTKSQKAEYAFTLTIPPESYELTIPQRVNRTKTFGGVFIDDYGIDNAKLTISGTTGGVTVRESYPNFRGAGNGLDGRGAIYELRDKIILYKRGKNNLGEYVIRAFDLSFDLGINTDNLSRVDAFECSLDDFRISRNKEKPLWYSFSMELFVIRRLGEYVPKKSDPFIAPEMLPYIPQKFGEKQDQWFADMDKFIRGINLPLEIMTDARDGLLKDYDQFNRRVIGWINSVQATGFGILKYPASTANAILRRAKALKAYVQTGFNSTFRSMSESVFAEYQAMSDAFNELLGLSAATVVGGKERGNASARFFTIEGEQSTLRSALDLENLETLGYQVNGYVMATATSATTFESLAVEYLGDARFASLIAQFNEIADIDHIEPGMALKVPVITTIDPARSADNQIFDWNLDDPYGTDVALDADGNIMWDDSGDLGIVSGPDNLQQAIISRFTESLGTRTRLTTYGLISSIGSPNQAVAPEAYLVASIIDTAVQDPRVQDISNIVVRGQGDALVYTFDILGIGGDNKTVTGVI